MGGSKAIFTRCKLGDQCTVKNDKKLFQKQIFSGPTLRRPRTTPRFSLATAPSLNVTYSTCTIRRSISRRYWKTNIEQIPGVSSKKYQVSWIRRSDGYPLYIGEERFINDKRFELISTRWVGQQARWVLGCLEQLLLGSNKVKVPQHTWEVTLN